MNLLVSIAIVVGQHSLISYFIRKWMLRINVAGGDNRSQMLGGLLLLITVVPGVFLGRKYGWDPSTALPILMCFPLFIVFIGSKEWLGCVNWISKKRH